MEERARAVAYKDGSKGEQLAPLFFYPGFSAAVFLDPRYMSLLTAEQTLQAKQYLVDLWDRIQAVRGPPVSQSDDSDAEGSDSSDDPAEDSDDEGTALFDMLLASRNRERLATTSAGAGSRARRRAVRCWTNMTAPLPHWPPRSAYLHTG